MTKKTALALACASLSVSIGNPAYAQEEQASGALEEIVVTARFREETVQDIGASIAALGNEEITSAGIVDFEDIARRVAGVAILDNGPNANEVSIRGVANGINANGRDAVEPLVSIYIDDVSVAAAGAGITRDINLFDFNRVEVLRGPQPTLFGEGSVGGVVRYFSQDPQLNGELDGILSGDLSFTDHGDTNYRVEGAGSFTLVPDVLGIRLAASYREDGGFIDNVALGSDDVNDLESVTGRAVILYQPNDNWTFRGAVTIARDEIGEYNEINAFSLDGSISSDDLIAPLFNTFDGVQEDDYDLFSGKISWDAGPVLVESITGFYQREIFTEILDAGLTVGLPAFFAATGLNAFANLGSYDPTSIRSVGQDAESFSQEFRFVSQLDGPLNYTAGLFYQDVDTDRESFITGPGYADITQPATTLVTDNLTEVNSEQISAFFELTYEVSDRVRLIGGTRYVNEEITNRLARSAGINLFAPIITGPPPNPVFFTVPDDLESLAAEGVSDPTFKFELDEFLPRIGFEFDVKDNVLLYGSAARGLRNGGQNSVLAARAGGAVGSPGFFDLLFFEPDEAKTAEVGVKSELMDGNMTLNLAAYVTDYEDPQIFVGTPIRAVSNAPDQDIFGIEVESSFVFNDHVSGYFAGSYTDAEYANAGQALPVPGDPNFLDIAEGNRAQSIPEFTFSAGLDFVYPTGWGGVNFTGRADFNYVDERFATAQNFPTTEIGSLELLNLRVGLEAENWSLVAYGTNITNDLELTNIIAAPNGAVLVNGVLDTPIATTVPYVNRPRTIGVSLTYRY